LKRLKIILMSSLNYKTWTDGMTGERAIGKLLNQSGIINSQIDRIAIFENKVVLFEIKTLKLFTKGINFPHDGHGIHPEQLKLKINIARKINADAILVIFCKTTNLIYYQNCENLLQCENYYKCKKHGQHIYPIDEFEVCDYNDFKVRIFRAR